MKKVIAVIFALFLFNSLLFAPGCPIMPSDSISNPTIVSDGFGGAIAVYEVYQRAEQQVDLYAQRLDAAGNFLWGEKGLLLLTGYKSGSSFGDCTILSDNSGIIVAWRAKTAKPKTNYITFVSRLDLQGNILWTQQGRYYTNIVSDGAGGVLILAQSDTGEGKYNVEKIDSQGIFPWGSKRPTITAGGALLQIVMVSDGAGGAFVAWETSIPAFGDNPAQQYIRAQRINPDGKFVWTQPLIVAQNTDETYLESIAITKVNPAGAAFAWRRYPQESLSDNSSPERIDLLDICVQKLDENDSRVWQANGLPLQIVATAGMMAVPTNPRLIDDGSKGIIVIWEDMRNGLASIYAQKLDASGAMLWDPGGVKVCYMALGQSFSFTQLISDGAGGVIVGCQFTTTSDKGIIIQKVDAAGDAVWTENGVVVIEGNISAFNISPDGSGGVLVAWGAGADVFAQLLDANGSPLWGSEGIRLNT
jgi:hypothetical protein